MTCSHSSLRADRTCKTCGAVVDIRQKRNKYGNRKDNGFDSKREARRYSQLLLMRKAGEIRNLQCQAEFILRVQGTTICKYRADFYYEDKHGNPVIEDAKGVRTAVYRLKKKLMKAQYGIEIQEV